MRVKDGDGKPETVAKQVLPAMLLNEVQKQSREITALKQQLATAQKENAEFETRMAARMQALEEQAPESKPQNLASAMR